MIKFENTKVMNFEGALRGMRNPLNSWDRSDSNYDAETGDFIIGLADMQLAQKLIKSGSDHRKFLRQIFVCVDITAPLYWWKEFDTYKVATVSNSCSTMHTLHKKPIELSDFSIDEINAAFETTITYCEYLRSKYMETKDKKYWRSLIQLLPSSYNQRRTITLTYETLRNIRKSRKDHLLSEWSVDCMNWIDTLPYADELIK